VSATLLTLHGQARIEAAQPKHPRLRIVAYRGGVMRVEGFGSVVVDLAGLTLPDNVPILGDHENRLDSILGTGKAEVRGGRELVIFVNLADTPAAQQVIELLRSGIELQASVGVEPEAAKRIRPGDVVQANGGTHEAPAAGLTLVTKGVLREVSVLPLGADGTTQVSLAARAAQSGVSAMDKDVQKNEAPADPVAAERARVAEIVELAADYPVIRGRAITEGWTIEATRAALLDILRASRPRGIVTHVDSSSAGVPARDLLCGALLLHAGYAAVGEKQLGERIMQAAGDLRCRTLLDLCAASLHMAGQEPPRDRTELVRASFSTTSMPVALGDAANKLALNAYRTAPATWRSFSKIVPLQNFKEHTMVRANFGGGFTQLPAHGSLEHGTLTEETYTVRGDTYGQIFGIDRKNVIDDDLQVLAGVAEALGRAGARAVSDVLYRVLLANLDPSGTAFFSEAHANLLSGAFTLLGYDSLANAIAVMTSRTDGDGRLVDLRPRTLVVPPELEQVARALLVSRTLARYTSEGTPIQPEGNPLFEIVGLAIEPRLSAESFEGSSPKGWYLFAAAEDVPVAVGFLDAREGPIVEEVAPPADKLGVMFRGYTDFGVSLVDWRAALKSEGE